MRGKNKAKTAIFRFRLRPEELARWRGEAHEMKISLASLIRLRMNLATDKKRHWGFQVPANSAKAELVKDTKVEQLAPKKLEDDVRMDTVIPGLNFRLMRDDVPAYQRFYNEKDRPPESYEELRRFIEEKGEV